MDSDALVSAVERLEQRGYRPAPLDMVSDELGWTGSAVLEAELDRLADNGRLECRKRPDCDPDYSTPLARGAS